MRKIRKFFLLFLCVFALFCVTMNYFYVAAPAIREVCRVEVSSVLRDSINDANEVLTKKIVPYSSVFEVVYSEEKEIVSISANTGLINQLSLLWGTEVEKRVSAKKEIPVTRRLGAFSGNSFLSNYGREVTLSCRFNATSRTEYRSVFVSQGINQTLHRLYLNVYVEAEILSPARCEKVEVTDSVLYAENVINGKVPSTYISAHDYAEYLDLLE